MTPLGDPRTHFWLTARAAKTCGIDLSQAMQDGLMTHAEWAEAVSRCRGCADPAACATWLNGAEEVQSVPPGYCRNATLFSALQGL